MNMQSSRTKVALVTGANKGIGFEIARQIGRAGVTVLLGARNKAAGEEAAATLAAEGIDARFIYIDVVDYTSIKEAAATITGLRAPRRSRQQCRHQRSG
jgi:NAD(P)-dependent dehydrogenase (short-subunit alcohol dehydrogenase family)